MELTGKQGRDMEYTQWVLKTGSLCIKSTCVLSQRCKIVILTMVYLWIMMKATAYETQNNTHTARKHTAEQALRREGFFSLSV